MSLMKKIAVFWSWPLKLLLWLRYWGRVSFGKGTILNYRFKFRGPGRLKISDNVNMWAFEEWNRFFTYDKNALIEIGKGTRLNGVTIQARKSVKIGKNCTIGSAMLIDNDFHSTDHRYRNDPAHIKVAPVIVRDNVWIAGQAVVLKGVKVGDRSVVGMRAVVTKDVEADTIVAGNPAKPVRRIANTY